MTRSKKNIFNIIFIIALVIVLSSSIIAGVYFGSVDIKFSEAYEIIIGKLFSLDSLIKKHHDLSLDVIWVIRFPRIILSVLVGAGLSISGTVTQSIVKNPLADPYLLGISSGAYLGAVLAVMLGFFQDIGDNFIGFGAFIGAFAVSVLVLVVSHVGGKANTAKLILTGVAISSAVSAVANFIVFIVNDSQRTKSITFWMMGSLAGAQWGQIKILAVVIGITSVYLYLHHKTLDLMLLGDEVSITLGTDLTLYRVKFLLLISLVVGLIVYSSGMIGFIGLLVPHFSRLIVGSEHKVSLLVSALLGSIVLIWADILSRILIPNTELPIGILISMIGSPMFIYLLIVKGFQSSE